MIVADTGAGIPPDEMPLLFEKFSQTSIGKSSAPGHGLGAPDLPPSCRGARRPNLGRERSGPGLPVHLLPARRGCPVMWRLYVSAAPERARALVTQPGGADQIDDHRETHERLATPGAADGGEEPMLDLVPLAGPGREVTDGDRQARAIGQPLQFPLPQAHARAIAAAGVGRDEQRACAPIAGPARRRLWILRPPQRR